jgi:hypothetical protein
MIKFASIVIAGFTFSLTVAPALAESILFAGYNQTSATAGFGIVSTTTTSNGSDFNVTISGADQISFQYLIGGTPFGMSSLSATLSLTATSTVSGDCPSSPTNCITSSGSSFTESGFQGNFAITLNTPFEGQSNLLSGTFNLLSPGDSVSGAQFGSTLGSSDGFLEATTTSSNPNQVVFTSDFLNFADTITRDATFNLSSLFPLFSAITNTPTSTHFPSDFSAIGSGAFSSAPPPFEEVPEPSTFAPLASGLLGLCLWQRKRRLLHR